MGGRRDLDESGALGRKHGEQFDGRHGERRTIGAWARQQPTPPLLLLKFKTRYGPGAFASAWLDLIWTPGLRSSYVLVECLIDMVTAVWVDASSQCGRISRVG